MDRRAILEDYKGIRDLRSRLHTQHVKEAMASVAVAAQRLGLLRGGQIVLDSEDEVAVLSDYCLYGLLEGEKSLVERIYEGQLPDEGTLERRTVEGMLRARFAFLRVDELDPGLGLVVRDLGRRERLFVVDVNLSTTTPVGTVLASRVLDYGAFFTLTGAALRFSPSTYEAVRRMVRQAFGREVEELGALGKEDDANLSMLVARTAIALSTDEPAAASGPGGDRARPAPPLVRSAPKVGRNEPCPCGSGKKYKKCCGAAG